jgi:hypothetical protein
VARPLGREERLDDAHPEHDQEVEEDEFFETLTASASVLPRSGWRQPSGPRRGDSPESMRWAMPRRWLIVFGASGLLLSLGCSFEVGRSAPR